VTCSCGGDREAWRRRARTGSFGRVKGEPRSLGALALLVLAGCFGNEETVFPPGLEPLEANALELPADFEATQFTMAVDGPRHDTIYARGYFDAPLAEVWAVFRDPVVGTDQRSADEWTSEPLEDPEYEFSNVVHSVAHDVITVEWSTTWRHGAVEGSLDAPELVAIRWQKTDGSTILRVIEGSIVLRPANEGTMTEIDFVYHADALGAGIDQYLLYVEDTLGDARALLNGEPAPTYD
jgi:hypothetical protein